MKNNVQEAINAVKANQYSFIKVISPNDAGETGTHQAGIYIPKNSIKLIFRTPGNKGQNEERPASIKWQDGTISECMFRYYGQGTRDEYRITRLGKVLSANDLILIIKETESQYLGFIFSNQKDQEDLLAEFNINREDTNSLIDKEKNTTELSFKPRAHILILLGEELIKSPVMAIYELIKNSYDADAKQAKVTFEDVSNSLDAVIKIEDDGTGITEETLKNVWFEPGTDYRKPIDSTGVRRVKRSPIFGRIPMGEKGIGRFAVHKLGNKIKLTTRPCVITVYESGIVEKELQNYELSVEIDWRRFSQSKYLEDVSIKWTKKEDPSNFKFKNHSGTYIEIEDLKEDWTRGMARDLKRNTISMLSPKSNLDEFRIDLDFYNNWLDDIPETGKILETAPYKLSALVDENYNLSFEYEFKLSNNNDLTGRRISSESFVLWDREKAQKNIRGELRPFFASMLERKQIEKELIDNDVEKMLAEKIPYGSLMVEMYSFDLDSASLRDTISSPSLVRNLLKDHAGVKVFKGDLRVFDYGDPGNDWLGLDLRRVNQKEWFSNNQVIGYVYLNSSTSVPLIEKTNREGFIQNEAFNHFLMLLDYLLTQFAAERQSDRRRWLQFNKKPSQNSTADRLVGFKQLIEASNIPDPNKQQLLLNEAEKLEEQYESEKKTLLIPAGVGMTASFAIHEIEKLVPRMQQSVNETPINQIKIAGQVNELKDYTDGILSVLRKGGNKPVPVEPAIKQAIRNYSTRLTARKIVVEEKYDPEAEVVMCDRRLLITIIMNLIDNSVYWLETVYRVQKKIFIGTKKMNSSVSVVVADNGPGFKDSIEDLIRPFFSRKEGGIGIGLFMVDTIMSQYGKLNILLDKAYLDLWDIPEVYTGAIVELKFNK